MLLAQLAPFGIYADTLHALGSWSGAGAVIAEAVDLCPVLG